MGRRRSSATRLARWNTAVTTACTISAVTFSGILAPQSRVLAAETDPTTSVVVRIDRQEEVVAITVDKIKRGERITVDWGDGRKSKGRTKCKSGEANRGLKKCSRTFQHVYSDPGIYRVVSRAKNRRINERIIEVLAIPQPWSRTSDWVQPDGWQLMTGQATFLPCSTVQWFWDTEGQPENRSKMRQTTREALQFVSDATGLTFAETTDPDSADIDFNWKYDDAKYPGAAGYAGVGRESGYVTLNPNDPWTSDEWAGWGTITRGYVTPEGYVGQRRRDGNGDLVLHEIGHVLGLGHVDDERQAMNAGASVTGRIGFGPGDLDGLSTMYKSQPCPRPEAL